MKVKEFLKKYRMSSNSSVFVQCVKTKDLFELYKNDIKNFTPDFAMDMKVNSFEVINNVMTIYADSNRV